MRKYNHFIVFARESSTEANPSNDDYNIRKYKKDLHH